MLLIVIVALIATGAFYRRAKHIGIHPGKAASIPFIAAGIALLIAYLASLGIARLAGAAQASPFTVRVVVIMLNLFVLLAYMTVIRRNWAAMEQASPAARADDME